MLVVDASCLFEVVADTPRAEGIRARLASDTDHVAPEVIDVEVLGVIRAQYLRGRLDATAAALAVDDLRDWPGERHSHRWMLDRVWHLRDTVRGWDAFYVTLAEAMDATLVTMDARLARAPGPQCPIEVLGGQPLIG
ncbi:type II toxin-antitoxin system VapC family toxin [Gordonia sp. PKS22-38]|uniref:Ribonuclease VapC n=1 Tax=Gordonia prachuapensis TaxID=3115651 RepID=A0ABU7MUA9_9ACTN|nr:type II toxin-antitoxin system VapC family toxin [Gordonia sp. PKS22-38]